MRLLAVFLFILSPFISEAQNHSHALGRKISFPDIPGYKTITTDFHIHTVFSDGSVWPDIRVAEAMLDGLDAISLTEHLEYQPHIQDIPHPDRNRSYELALEHAKDHDLMIIPGSEITRRMPPGHSNALFISDANKLLMADSVAVFNEAKKQGAFVFWNHPNWISQRADGVATLTQLHRNLIKEGKLHGIEVVNERTYSDEALQLALDNNLTIMGTSDIHGLVDWEFSVPQGGHRPITLVFGKEKNIESIKEGLFEKRTVVFYNNLLIGREAYLKPLIESSLNIRSTKYIGKSNVLAVEIENLSSAPFTLQNKSNFTLHSHADVFEVKAFETVTIEIKTLKLLEKCTLEMMVLNAITAPKKHPSIILAIDLKD